MLFFNEHRKNYFISNSRTWPCINPTIDRLKPDSSYPHFYTIYTIRKYFQTIYTSSNMKNESHPSKRIDRDGKHNKGGQGVRRCFIAWRQINIQNIFPPRV